MAAHGGRDLHATVEDAEDEHDGPTVAKPSPSLHRPASTPSLHRPTPLDLTSIAHALDLAKAQPSISPGSPIRYTMYRPPPRQRKQKPNSPPPQPHPPPSPFGQLPSPFGQMALRPPIPVADILHHNIKARAVYWMNRALHPDTTTMVLQNDVYAAYSFSFAPYIQDGAAVLSPGELTDLVTKMFRGTEVQVGDLERPACYVIRNLAWRGLPTGGEVAGQWRAALEWDAAGRTMGEDGGDYGSGRVMVPNMPTNEALSLERARSAAAPPAGAGAGVEVDVDEYDDHIPVLRTLTPHIIASGRKLWRIPEPARTKLWLRMLFEKGENEEVEESSLWLVYEETFGKFYKTRPHLDDVGLVECICKVFPEAEEVEVAPEKHVIYGIRPRDERREPSTTLKHYHHRQSLHQSTRQSARTRRQLELLEAHGALTLRINRPLNAFQEHLLDDPLLSLPAGTPSPWLQRLRKRREGGKLGNEQPGFPGISMKDLSKELKWGEWPEEEGELLTADEGLWGKRVEEDVEGEGERPRSPG